MLLAAVIIVILTLSIFLFMRTAPFGKMASGSKLQRIRSSSNYRDGQFQNVSYTPNLEEGVSYLTVMRKFFFGKSKRSTPPVKLPSIKNDLHSLNPEENVFVWFGHSSYFLQVDGKKILVDPVFSGHASPVKFTTKSFKGSDIYSVDDIPAIDFLFLSHDHWDHLDYETLVKLKPKVTKIFTALGVGAHLQRWGFNCNLIKEFDWDEGFTLQDGFKINTVTARHFSGRGFKRNQSLWLSFVLATPTMKIFIGGDSGYDTHFATAGKKFGPFDLAILECGQYNEYWKYIHMMPEEVVLAAQDLGARKFVPVHWGKFSLSLHAWDEPIIRVTNEAKKEGVAVITPRIGEIVYLQKEREYERWWEGLK